MSIINQTKEVVELVRKLDNVELYKKIVELEGQIVEAERGRLLLEKERDELKQKLSVKENLKCVPPFYEDAFPRSGILIQYCPRCYEKHERAVPLKDSISEPHRLPLKYCTACLSRWELDEDSYHFNPGADS